MKTIFFITDSRRGYSYGGKFRSLDRAMEAAREKPIRSTPYFITDNHGRIWTIDGVRI